MERELKRALTDGHLADRLADADDIVSFGNIHCIFAGGLLHRYFFHPDTYHAVDFEFAADRSVFNNDLVVVGTDLYRVHSKDRKSVV